MLKFKNTPEGRPAKKRVTQKEIAEIAGVSHVTVSYALHRTLEAPISKEKQQEIRRIAAELGYQVRPMTTYNIGLALPVQNLRLDITSSLILMADEILRSRGYRLTLATYDDHGVYDRGFILDQKNADGVILTEPFSDVSKIIAPNLPRVLMADADDDHIAAGIDQVSMDTRESMKTVVSYAVSRGHKRLGLVSSAHRSIYDTHLREGFRAGLKEQGLPAANGHMIKIGPAADTADPLLKCLAGPNPPTLIIAGSSARALSTLNGLQWAGYRVPEDVSLISFIDHERLSTLRPKITATSASGYDVVALAIERLLQKIDDPDSPAQRTMLPAKIVERESVKTLWGE